MQDCTRQKTKTVNLGRLPLFCGSFKGTNPEDQYDPAVGYHKYNIVTYLGSSFINLVEGNQKDPVIEKEEGIYVLEDGEGNWSGWNFIANALDAHYWAEKIDKNFFSLEFDQNTGDFIGYYGVGGFVEDVYTEYDDGDMWLEIRAEVA